MHRTTALALATAATVILAACGDDGGDTDAGSDQTVDRTIEIDMLDVGFEPAEVEVAAGETVRFVFANRGQAVHDAFLGDAQAQEDHGEEMADDHGGGHGDDEEGITVEPGETAEIVHTFDADDDDVLIGCHQPGHYEAGMVTTIRVR